MQYSSYVNSNILKHSFSDNRDTRITPSIYGPIAQRSVHTGQSINLLSHVNSSTSSSTQALTPINWSSLYISYVSVRSDP